MALAKEKTKIKTDYSSLNVCITGAPGVGKSTFASQLGDDVYIFALEKGYDFQEVYLSVIKSWDDFAGGVNDLLTEKHNHKHVVLDTIDILYQYAEDEICKRNKVNAIADIPFGGGYKAARRMLMNEFLRLNNHGMGITFITHERIKEKKKDAVSYSAVCTSLGDSVEEMILGACDIGFFCYVDKDKIHKVRTKPTRYIECAKDRSGWLPEVMELKAGVVMKHINEIVEKIKAQQAQPIAQPTPQVAPQAATAVKPQAKPSEVASVAKTRPN